MTWLNIYLPENKLIQVKMRNRKAPGITTKVTGKYIEGDFYPEDGGVCNPSDWEFEAYRKFVDIYEGNK